VLGVGLAAVGQVDKGSSSTAPQEAQIGSGQEAAAANPQTAGAAATGTIQGTVLDPTGVPVSGAQVRLTREPAIPVRTATTEQDGQFSFTDVPPGTFDLSITFAGFKVKDVAGTLSQSDGGVLPAIKLELAPIVSDVTVHLTVEEIATEQIKEQEQQRLVGVIPNFYATYAKDPAPMTSKQKFGLAWKAAIDPTSFVIAGIIAGGEQANNSFPGYGQGAAGYFNRFGAAYGDFFIGTYISNAILPSLFKQDPRYFYKGTGSVNSRILWALKRAVMTRGDNGHWQPDYSGILGAMATGSISNLYYPEGSHRGFETTLTNTAIGIGTSAAVNILQEFVFPKVTPKVAKAAKDPPKS
jgi:hypothetical protein